MLAYLPEDEPGANFYIHRVRMDSDTKRRLEGGYCFTERMRLATGSAAVPPTMDSRAGEAVTEADGTFSPKQPILACPSQQPRARNGQRPDPELLKRLIRCHKGEKPAQRGSERAVIVDVRAVEIGSPRAWAYNLDRGSGTVDTIVHPVKATYDVTTYYRTVTEVEEGWIRILNTYVDSLGEWRIGSEEQVKASTQRSYARKP